MNRHALNHPQRRLLRFLEANLYLGDALIIPSLRLQVSYVSTNKYGVALVLHQRAAFTDIVEVWQRDEYRTSSLYLPLMTFLSEKGVNIQDCEVAISGSAELIFNTARWQLGRLAVV